MTKPAIFLLSALIPLLALANTPAADSFDSASDETTTNFAQSNTNFNKQLPQNILRFKYVDVNSKVTTPNWLDVTIEPVKPDEKERYSITDGAKFGGAYNSNSYYGSYEIIVSAERILSKSPVKWLNAAMKDLDLNQTDIAKTHSSQPSQIENFPRKLDYVYQTTLFIQPPNSNETYSCEDVIIAEGLDDVYWITGNRPNLSMNQKGLPAYRYLPIIDCQSTSSSSTLKVYVGAANAREVQKSSDIMVLNYSINN